MMIRNNFGKHGRKGGRNNQQKDRKIFKKMRWEREREREREREIERAKG
jgi:hypothetical protein